MNRIFRKYHRWIAIILCLPLITTTITGMGFTIFHEWFKYDAPVELLLSIHTFSIVKLGKLFPILTGIGLLGLLATGMNLSGLFRDRPAA